MELGNCQIEKLTFDISFLKIVQRWNAGCSEVVLLHIVNVVHIGMRATEQLNKIRADNMPPY